MKGERKDVVQGERALGMRVKEMVEPGEVCQE